MRPQHIILPFCFVLLFSCGDTKTEHAEGMAHDGMDNMIMLTQEEIAKANIRVDTAKVKNISELSTLTGIVAIDQNRVADITSRAKGRLERMYIRSTGEYVLRGQLLYDIYSEALLADENDYLLALDQYKNAVTQKETARQLMEGAKRKLLQWTITEEQIKELERTNKPSPQVAFFSDASGYITEVQAREGEYVEIGSPIAKIADLSSVWVEVQVYSEEMKFLKQNPQLSVEADLEPGILYDGQIVFDNPSFEANQKVSLVRLRVENKTGSLKPGMMTYIYLKRNEKKALVIPRSALLIEKMISVWVRTSEGMFEPRMVTVGVENKYEVEIASGLNEGDIVVISGAYFLKSEQTVKEGSNSMGGMKM